MREITLPFRVDNHGYLATTRNPDVIARQHLTTYLLTAPGERVMRPGFGTPIRELTFEQLDPVQLALLLDRVRGKIAQDVSYIRLMSLGVDEDSDQSALRLTVEFAVAEGPVGQSGVQTTTIELRGDAL